MVWTQVSVNDQGKDSDPGLDSALEDLLKSLPPEEPDGPVPDPARVAAHLSGVGDAALLDEAAARDSVRRVLSDVADAVLSTDDVPDVADVSPAVLAGAVAAFGAPSAEASEASYPPRDLRPGTEDLPPARPAARRWLLGTARAAAGLLVVAGTAVAVAALLGRSVEASPSLVLAGVESMDSSGTVAAEGPRRVAIGQRFQGGAAGRMALKFAGGARVLLGHGDEVRVACDGATCGHAALALDRGEVLVSAADGGGTPVRLLLPGGGVLDVSHGVVHVALTAAGEAAVSLRPDGEVIWGAPGKKETERVAGPATVLLSLAGAKASGPAAESVFRDLEFFGGEFFGGSVRKPSRSRDVPATMWRILAPAASGRAAARASDDEGSPAVAADLDRGDSVRVAWLPDDEAFLGGRIVVRVRVQGAGGIAPPDAPPAAVRVALEGVPGAEASLEAGTGGGGPGSAVLALPRGWGSLLAGKEAVLSISATGAPVRAWFTAASFLPAGGETPRPDPTSPGVR